MVGKGPMAKAGSKGTVYYISCLKQNNKQFHSTSSGARFKFLLGHCEVNNGWDIAVAGMKVGMWESSQFLLTWHKVLEDNLLSNFTFEVELHGIH